MARGRRRSGSFRRPQRKADWVYRPPAMSYDAEGDVTIEDGLGTYYDSYIAHNVGSNNAQSHVLYDSHNYITNWAAAGEPNNAALAPQFLLNTARAERGRKPLILAVEGMVVNIPGAWTLGDTLEVGMRIGVWEQDAITGVFSVDPSYTMWGALVGNANEPAALWANNGRNNAWERRYFKQFAPGSEAAYQVCKIRWRGRRVLEANECFGLYTEWRSSSVTGRAQYFLRTLVADDV